MLPTIGPLEIIVVLVIVLIIFGPKRLPGLGKSLCTGMREFKDSIGGNSNDDEQAKPEPSRAELPATRIDADRPEDREPSKSAGGPASS